MSRKALWLLCALALFAALGMAHLGYATAQGVGLSPDSAVYLGAARSLLAGQGLRTLAYDGTLGPMTHYPPLYPALLALLGLCGVDILDAARWLTVLLYGANIALAGWLVYRLSRGDALLAGLAGLATLTALPVLSVHSWAWSEPLFMTLGLLGFLALDCYLQPLGDGRRERRYLWLSGGALGLALLTRYPGIALVATAVLWRLLSGPGSARRRLADAFHLGLLGCLPVAAWFVRNLLESGGLANRTTVYHAITKPQWEQGLKTLAKWVRPGQPAQLGVGWAVLGGFTGLALLGGLRCAWRARRRSDTQPAHNACAPLLPGLFALIYLGFVVVSLLFFDAHTPLDDRILLPVWLAGTICLLSLTGSALRTTSWWTWLAPLAVVLVLAVPQGQHSLSFVKWMRANGEGFGSKAWRHSAVIEQIRALPAETPLISNGPDAIYMLTGHPSAWLPYEVHAGTRQNNSAYDEQMRTVYQDYAAKNGLVVYFTTISYRWYLPSLDKLKRDLPLEPVYETRDGAIYRLTRPNP